MQTESIHGTVRGRPPNGSPVGRRGSRRSTVLYVDAYPTIGGGQRSLYALVTHLTPGRYRPVVGVPPSNPLRARLAGAGVRTVPLHFGRRNNSLPDLSSPGAIAGTAVDIAHVTWEIAQAARHVGAELIHANSVVAGVHALPVAITLGLPCVVHCRDFETSRLTNLAVETLAHYRRAVLVFVSQSLARVYEAEEPRGYRTRVIYNGVDTELFKPDPQARPRLLESLGLPQDTFLAGAVGQLEPWKGFELVLDSFAPVVAGNPEARLIIVGRAAPGAGNYRGALQRKIGTLGLNGRAMLIGFREDMPEVLAALDLLVHCPTGPEPFGRIIIEALACGRPVVTVPTGGIPEIVTGNRNALLAAAGDVESIARAMTRIIKEPSLAARLGEEGRRDVQERFCIPRHVEQIEGLYDQLLRKSTHVAGEHLWR